MKKFLHKFILLTSALLILLTCSCKLQAPHANGDEINAALQNSIANNKNLAKNKSKHRLPSAVQNALLPDLGKGLTQNTAKDVPDSEQRFDISVNNIPAKDFFMGLVKGTKYNMTLSPDITGTISLELKNVTIPQVMEAVHDAFGYEYETTSYGYTVFPKKLSTRIFTVNSLDINRSGSSQTTIGSGQITRTIQSSSSSLTSSTSNTQQNVMPTGEVDTSSKIQFWELLKQNLLLLIGDKDGHSVVINQNSGVVIVRAYPDELRNVAEYLDDIQNISERQVIIEAKILEVQLSAEYKAGINWKLFGIQQGLANATADLSPDITAFTPAFALNVTSGSSFNTAIQFLNSQGKVNVLSSPRIATTNNQKAVIKVGNDRFFVTNVSSSTTTSTTTQNSQNIELTPFFSGIALDVTPQIDQNDVVTLHIHPVVSKVTQDNQNFTVNGLPQNLPLAESSVRESDSIVRAESGQVIVIGGLMENYSNEQEAGTPGLAKLPDIGGLFKSANKQADKFELVILLRPIVISGASTWQKRLKDAAQVFRNTPKDFSYNIVPKNKPTK